MALLRSGKLSLGTSSVVLHILGQELAHAQDPGERAVYLPGKLVSSSGASTEDSCMVYILYILASGSSYILFRTAGKGS